MKRTERTMTIMMSWKKIVMTIMNLEEEEEEEEAETIEKKMTTTTTTRRCEVEANDFVTGEMEKDDTNRSNMKQASARDEEYANDDDDAIEDAADPKLEELKKFELEEQE